MVLDWSRTSLFAQPATVCPDRARLAEDLTLWSRSVEPSPAEWLAEAKSVVAQLWSIKIVAADVPLVSTVEEQGASA